MQEFLGSLLNRVGRAVWSRSAAALEDSGISPREYGLVDRLVELGAMSQTRLSQLSGIDRTTMVAAVDELERLGFVVRRRDPDDRRAYLVEPTDRGRDLVSRHRSALREIERDVLSVLGADERTVFLQLLVRIEASVDS